MSISATAAFMFSGAPVAKFLKGTLILYFGLGSG